MATTTVTDLTVAQILEDVPADTSQIGEAGNPVSTARVERWKASAEARAALLLRSQNASTDLSDDAKLFAADYVRFRVIAEVLRKMKRFDIATEYAEEAKALEDVLKSFEEELDQAAVGASKLNHNVDTNKSSGPRWGSEFTGM